MFARTSNIFRTQVFVKATKALAALVVLIISSCSSNSVIEDIPDIQPSSTDLMSFTCNVQDNTQQSNTRASDLTTGFLVSTYKAYQQANQQMVMEKYNVERKTSGTAWDGTVRAYWDYTKVTGQYEKYWDYSNFPYRFHAIAPCPADPSDFVLNDKQLKIAAPYYYQTCSNGSVYTKTADGSTTAQPAEPYMLAQVHRAANGSDTDLLARADKQAINTGSPSLNRTVWMPFHHLNSKIRFGVYSLQPWVSANHLYIKGLTIKVASGSFVTTADGYQANVSTLTDDWCIDTGTSGFTGLTRQDNVTLFQFDGGENVEGNDMRECQTQKTAYMLQCPGGIMQLPQENIRLTVSFNLMKPGSDTPYKTFTDVPVAIQLPDETLQPILEWQPGYIYTYYLVIGGIEDKLEITFTATLTPWEDVSGSLTTDLEK